MRSLDAGEMAVSGPPRPDTHDTYVLTLKLDPVSFQRLDQMRRDHFPPALNRIPAHLTLLHRLDAKQVGRILDLRAGFGAEPPVMLEFLALRSTGQGVSLDVRSGGLHSLRSAVVAVAGGEFSRQDRQGFRPHVTVQNKVPQAQARETLTHLSQDFVPWRGAGQALLIWRYLGGPWGFEHELPFARSD